jgi:four helix bundle protein
MSISMGPTFEDWVRSWRIEELAVIGPPWRMSAYRKALYALHLGWPDAVEMHRHMLLRPVAVQLYRALGSVAANIAEGYSRSSGKDRVRLFEYALGSARECQTWYLASKPILSSGILAHRLDALAQISKLLVAAIPSERRRQIRPGPMLAP